MTARQHCLWAIAALAFTPVIVFGANGTVIVLLFLALAAPGGMALREMLADGIKTPAGLALAGLLAVALLSLLWTPQPGDAGEKLVRLLALWIGGLAALLSTRSINAQFARYFASALPVCMVLPLLIYWEELASSAYVISLLTGVKAAMHARFDDPQQQEFHRQLYGFTTLARGTGLLAIFVWPAMACLYGLRRHYGGWLAIGLGFALFCTSLYLPLGAASLAIVAGVAAFSLCYFFPRRGPKIFAALAIAMVIAAPFVAYSVSRPEVIGIEKRALPASWQHRIEIWHYTAEKIAQKPLLGWGFDSARHLEGGKTQFIVEAQDGSQIAYPGVGLLPLHPHNGVLQIWLELGTAGAALAIFMLFLLGRKLAEIGAVYGRIHGGLAAASAASALTILVLSFGLWQSWWQAGLWLGVVLWAAVLRVLNPR